MSLIILNVDEVRRTLSASGGAFVVHDKEVDIVRFALNTGFTDVVLDENTALRVMYQRPGESQVRALTLTYYDTDGLHNYYDWHLLPADLTEKGTLTVALCILRTDGDVEEWHTTPCQVRVLDSIHTDDSDEADETITPTVAQRVAVLETMIQRVASGAPIVVASTSAMTDTDQIYVLSTDGNWYYHNGTAWTVGGEYGAVATDTTLTQAGIPADAKVVGDTFSQISGDIKSYEILTNETNKFINYNYDISSQREPNPASSTSSKLGYKRNKNLIILNGELNYDNSSVGTYVRLNGNISTTTTPATVDGWTNGVVLETGHQYKVVGKLVSGSFSSTSGTLPSVSVYKVGTHSSVGKVKRDSKHFVRAFTADGSAYNFCIYIANNTTYTDAGILITLEDVTDSGNNSIIERNDPIRTTALLNALTGKTRISGTTFGKKPLCLIHFSDIHGDAECLKNVIRFKDEYSGYIDDIIHTGDTVHYSAEEGTDFWANTEGAENILNAIGNHDTNTRETGSNNWTGLGMADSYDTYFSPYIDNWNVTYESGITYYYKDYITESVRLIVLDIMHQTEDQLSWFVDTLAGARGAGLDVIIASHSKGHWLLTPQDCVWDDRVNVPAYTGVGTDTSANRGGSFPTNFSAEYSDAVDDHIEAGGMFIAWIHGHTHYRILAKLTEHPNQLDMAVANAGRPADFAWTNVWNRVDNTKSMDDFNVIAIDTTGKILRAAKFGVDTDRHMRIAHAMSYDYDTHTIITAE